MHSQYKGQGRPLGELVRQFALEEGIVHKAGRHAGKVNEAELARQLHMRQPTVHRILIGEISKPSQILIRALNQRFGVTVGELLGEAESEPFSVSARHMAERWDQLPTALKEFIRQQIHNYEELQAANPALARLLFQKPARGAYPEIERYQDTHQINPRAPE